MKQQCVCAREGEERGRERQNTAWGVGLGIQRIHVKTRVPTLRSHIHTHTNSMGTPARTQMHDPPLPDADAKCSCSHMAVPPGGARKDGCAVVVRGRIPQVDDNVK